ncbi:MAG: hypothetical protein ACI9U2_005018 [Bradymonadia bacterium]|jgi:hypothetical protein
MRGNPGQVSMFAPRAVAYLHVVHARPTPLYRAQDWSHGGRSLTSQAADAWPHRVTTSGGLARRSLARRSLARRSLARRSLARRSLARRSLARRSRARRW